MMNIIKAMLRFMHISGAFAFGICFSFAVILIVFLYWYLNERNKKP